jgi:hypothetical protein
MNKRPIVYIAGPYTGNEEANVERFHTVADKLIDLGLAPYNPLLSHYQHAHGKKDYETWMEIDMAFLVLSNAVLRLSGDSPGADRETEKALLMGIPVFSSIVDLEEHFKGVEE